MPPLNHHFLIEGPGGVNQVKQAGAYYSKLPIYVPTIGSVDGSFSIASPTSVNYLLNGSDVMDITPLGVQINGPYGFKLTAGAALGKVLTSDALGNATWQPASAGTASPLTTKGDLYTFSTVNARLGVGADGTILIADSTQATGIKWGAAPASGVTSIGVSGGTTGLTTSGGPITTSGTITLAGILGAANGGSGRATAATAYGLIAAGTTATGVQQTIAPGTAGQFLKSGGPSALGAFASIVEGDVTNLVTDLAAKAPLASPALTGSPTAPTQTAGDNSTKIATTAYVDVKAGTQSLIRNEVPAGTPNGVLVTFTLASTPATNSLALYKNAIRLKPGGADYTLAGNTITFVTAPPTGAVLLADYEVSSSVFSVGTNSLISDETPTGTVNGSTVIFTTSRAYIAGSLEVYVNGMKQVRGQHFTETTPGSGTFTMSDAPLTGDVISVNYQFNLNPSSNADTVDGIHASTTPTAGQLSPLIAKSTDANGWTKYDYGLWQQYMKTGSTAFTIAASTWAAGNVLSNLPVGFSTIGTLRLTASVRSGDAAVAITVGVQGVDTSIYANYINFYGGGSVSNTAYWTFCLTTA